MATDKQRINITPTPGAVAALRLAARRDRVPVATKAAEMLEAGLELEEDVALAGIALQRGRSGGKDIPHERAWL